MVALCTGASGGLGTAVVQHFLDAGASAVFGVARSWVAQPVQDERFHAVEADLTKESEAARVAQEAQPLDALVHLVGAFAGGKPVADADLDTWDAMMNVNARAAFVTCRAVLPQMIENRRGRIVVVSSKAGQQPQAKAAAYSASKAALEALVRSLALEVKQYGISVNAIAPGTIDTPANRRAMPGADASDWVKPETIAKALFWLASDAAAGVTGAVIPVS